MAQIEKTHVQYATRTQKRTRKTREKLLLAAKLMFCEKGVDLTTIEDITEKADLGKGTFYRHFSSKDEVVLALVEVTVENLIARINLQKKPQQNLPKLLEHLLDTHLDFFLENREEFLLLFQGRLMLQLHRDAPESIEPPFLKYLKEIESQLAPFIGRPIDPSQARRVAFAIAGLVSGFFSFAMIGMSPKEIEKTLKPLRRAFISGSRLFLAHTVETVEPPAETAGSNSASAPQGAAQVQATVHNPTTTKEHVEK